MAIASDIKVQHPGVLLLRFTVSVLMLSHGVAKLTRVPWPAMPYLASES